MRYFYIFSVLCASLFSTGSVVAQTSTATSTDSTIFEAVIQNVSNLKDQVTEQITGEAPGRDAVLTKRTQERIINLAANISNRFEGLIARLENIAGRLQKRIDKLASEGYDVSAATTSLVTVRTELSAAKTEMNSIDAAVTNAIGSTDPRGEWRGVRVKFLTTRDHIKAAHGALRDTITAVKTAQSGVPIPPAATSTATTT